jgi:hypothetical protein
VRRHHRPSRGPRRTRRPRRNRRRRRDPPRSPRAGAGAAPRIVCAWPAPPSTRSTSASRARRPRADSPARARSAGSRRSDRRRRGPPRPPPPARPRAPPRRSPRPRPARRTSAPDRRRQRRVGPVDQRLELPRQRRAVAGTPRGSRRIEARAPPPRPARRSPPAPARPARRAPGQDRRHLLAAARRWNGRRPPMASNSTTASAHTSDAGDGSAILDLLGRHVRHRAGQRVLGGVPAVLGSERQPEIDHDHRAGAIEDQVVGLEVAVHQPRGVDRRHRVRRRDDSASATSGTSGPSVRAVRRSARRGPASPGTARPIDAGVDQPHHAGMIDAPQAVDLATEPRQRVGAEIIAQPLERPGLAVGVHAPRRPSTSRRRRA